MLMSLGTSQRDLFLSIWIPQAEIQMHFLDPHSPVFISSPLSRKAGSIASLIVDIGPKPELNPASKILSGSLLHPFSEP